MPWWGYALIAAGAVVLLVLSYAAFSRKLFADLFKRREPYPPVNDLQRRELELAQSALAWLQEIPHESVGLTGEGGCALYGVYLDNRSDKTAVLVHGYAGDWTTRAHNARLYRSLGFNVLLVDNPGHGKSGGAYITMGYQDAPALLYWTDWLVRTKNTAAIVLDGVSMGAAAVLSVANYGTRSAIKGIVSDCSFTSAYDELRSQCKRRHIPCALLLRSMCRLARKHGFDLREKSPIEGVRRSTVPTLFIHGDKDRFVPFGMVRALYDANASEKRLLVTEGVPHAASYLLAEEKYTAAVADFVTQVTA